jgi:predicted transcriptional regulator
MSHDLNLSPEIESKLFEYAEATGQDAVHLMQLVVSRFVEHEIPRDGEPEWTDELNRRRVFLIEKDVAGELNVEEKVELHSLQKRAERYFDKVSSPDIETPTQLLEQLLAKANQTNGQE